MLEKLNLRILKSFLSSKRYIMCNLLPVREAWFVNKYIHKLHRSLYLVERHNFKRQMEIISIKNRQACFCVWNFCILT